MNQCLGASRSGCVSRTSRVLEGPRDLEVPSALSASQSFVCGSKVNGFPTTGIGAQCVWHRADRRDREASARRERC